MAATMAEQETTVPIEDKGMLSDIMAETPERSEPEVTETEERPRDEAGRFVSKAPDAEAAPTQQQAPETAPQPDDDKAAQVPSWRLRGGKAPRAGAARMAGG